MSAGIVTLFTFFIIFLLFEAVGGAMDLSWISYPSVSKSNSHFTWESNRAVKSEVLFAVDAYVSPTPRRHRRVAMFFIKNNYKIG